MKYYSVQVGTEKFQITEAERNRLVQLTDSKQRGMFTTGGGSFLIERVSSIKPVNFVDYAESQEPKRQWLPADQRAKNLHRLHIAKLYLRRKWNPKYPVPSEDEKDLERFTLWMDSPSRVEHRNKRLAFWAEFFDVEFKTHEEMEASFEAWLKATGPDVDPREYDRDKLTPTALGMRDVTEAKTLFGATSA